MHNFVVAQELRRRFYQPILMLRIKSEAVGRRHAFLADASIDVFAFRDAEIIVRVSRKDTSRFSYGENDAPFFVINHKTFRQSHGLVVACFIPVDVRDFFLIAVPEHVSAAEMCACSIFTLQQFHFHFLFGNQKWCPCDLDGPFIQISSPFLFDQTLAFLWIETLSVVFRQSVVMAARKEVSIEICPSACVQVCNFFCSDLLFQERTIAHAQIPTVTLFLCCGCENLNFVFGLQAQGKRQRFGLQCFTEQFGPHLNRRITGIEEQLFMIDDPFTAWCVEIGFNTWVIKGKGHFVLPLARFYTDFVIDTVLLRPFPSRRQSWKQRQQFFQNSFAF